MEQAQAKPIWRFLVIAYLTLLTQAVIDNSRGPVYPDLLEQFQITPSRGAYLFALASFAGLIANASARFWLPRIGIAVATILALTLMGIGTIAFGKASLFGLWMIDLSSIIMGLGMGFGNVTMNVFVARGAPEWFRRRAYAGLHAIYGLGSLSAPLILSYFLTIDSNWGHFFVWLIILPIISLAYLIFNFNSVQSSIVNIAQTSIQTKIEQSLSTRLRFGLVFGFYVASEIVVSSRLVFYLSKSRDVPIEDARLALSIFFLTLLTGRLLFALVPMRGSSFVWLVVSCLSTITIFFISKITSPMLLSFTGLTMSFFFPVGMDWLTKKCPRDFELMTASVLTTISVILVTMHLGFGQIAQTLGIEAAMALVPILQFVSFILILTLGKSKPV